MAADDDREGELWRDEEEGHDYDDNDDEQAEIIVLSVSQRSDSLRRAQTEALTHALRDGEVPRRNSTRISFVEKSDVMNAKLLSPEEEEAATRSRSFPGAIAVYPPDAARPPPAASTTTTIEDEYSTMTPSVDGGASSSARSLDTNGAGRTRDDEPSFSDERIVTTARVVDEESNNGKFDKDSRTRDLETELTTEGSKDGEASEQQPTSEEPSLVKAEPMNDNTTQELTWKQVFQAGRYN